MSEKELKETIQKIFEQNMDNFVDVLLNAINMEKEDGLIFMRENMEYLV